MKIQGALHDLQNYQIVGGFLSFHACVLSFFCCWLRFNRQVNLLLFHQKLPFFACLASNSSKDHQQKNEATFLYHGFSKEAWASSHLWIHHWQPFVVSKAPWLLWWAPSARPKVPEAVRQELKAESGHSLPWLLHSYSGQLPSAAEPHTASPWGKKSLSVAAHSPWVSHGGSIPAHRWGNPQQAPSPPHVPPQYLVAALLFHFVAVWQSCQ